MYSTIIFLKLLSSVSQEGKTGQYLLSLLIEHASIYIFIIFAILWQVNLLRMQVPFVFSYLYSCVHILSLSCVVMVGMGSHFYGAKDFQIYILFSLINSCIAATSLSLFKTTLEFPMRSMVHVCKYCVYMIALGW